MGVDEGEGSEVATQRSRGEAEAWRRRAGRGAGAAGRGQLDQGASEKWFGIVICPPTSQSHN